MTRINKYLAEKNIASRRESDTLIREGKVFINGTRAVLGAEVTERDRVEVRNNTKECVYYAYNKPKGIVTTNPQAGETDIIHHTKFPVKVFPIGRLDKDSHGLMIMTNDGRITKKLLDPEFEHEKEYEVIVDKQVTPEFIKKMSSGGIQIETNKNVKHDTRPAKLLKLGANKFSIIVTEGKNRQIRRMCESQGYRVTDLKRVRLGRINLGTIGVGKFKAIKFSQNG